MFEADMCTRRIMEERKDRRAGIELVQREEDAFAAAVLYKIVVDERDATRFSTRLEANRFHGHGHRANLASAHKLVSSTRQGFEMIY